MDQANGKEPPLRAIDDLPAHAPPSAAIPALPGPPDADILRAVAAGDFAHFDTFVDRYKVRLIRYLAHRTGDRDAAEDLAQDVLIRVLRGAFAGRSSVATWVFSIANRCAIDHARSRRRRRDPAGHPADEPASHALDPALLAMRQDSDRRVERLLAQLPPPQREVIALKVFGDLSFTEVATVLGRPVGTVKSQMRYGLQKLHELLSCENPSD
jgi:RNA polymerase sigma-70 factor (ECF subfamily)